MATMQLYGKFSANVLGGETAGEALMSDYLSNTLKMTLHTSTYVPNIDTNEVYADATNELATANGYTNGGYTLTSPTISYNATGNVTTFDFGDVTVSASGGTLTFQIAVVRDSTVATGPLYGYIDLGAQSITTGNSLVIATGASGAFTGTVS